MLILTGWTLLSGGDRERRTGHSNHERNESCPRPRIKEYIIIIDVARLFDGTNDYPTIEELRQFCALNGPSYQLRVSNDVIRVHPNRDIQSEF